MKKFTLTVILSVLGISFAFAQEISLDDIQKAILEAQERHFSTQATFIGETHELVRQHISQEERNRLEPFLRAVVADERHGISTLRMEWPVDDLDFVTKSIDNEQSFDVIIHTDYARELRGEYNSLFTVMPGFVTARVTASELSRMASDNRISFIETGHMNYPELDLSLFETGAQYLLNGSINNTVYDGEGAIVLIFDTGMDITHPDFLNPDNPEESRVLYLWDVLLNPVGDESTPRGEPDCGIYECDLDYGVEYSREEINAALRGEFNVRSRDTNGHGSHVAGPASANGDRFHGIAPGADLIVVRGGASGFSGANIINGLHYAKMKSNELGKPVVVNFSLGGHSAKDGTRPDEQAINYYSQNPGYVVVNSAGNSGGNFMHSEHIIAPGESSSITIRVAEYDPQGGAGNDFFQMDAYTASGNPAINVTASSPNGAITDLTFLNPAALESSVDTLRDSSDGSLYISNSTLTNGDRGFFFQIWDRQAANTPAVGDWEFTFDNVSDEEVRINAFLFRTSQSMGATRKVGGDNRMTVTSPANAELGITVGNYMSKINWLNFENISYQFNNTVQGDIASSSSRGPTRDYREKPDIAAPGFVIMSSYSASSSRGAPFVAPGEQHVGLTGTSMAAPHVTGAVAVLLGINPELTATEINDLLREAARQDSFTGNEEWSETWGTGKMDLLTAALMLLDEDLDFERERIQHHDRLSPNAGPVRISGFQQAAMKFSPSFDGVASHAFLHTHEIVRGEGNLIVSLRSSVDGEPGGLLGKEIHVPLSRIQDMYLNHFDISSNGVELTAGEEYFVTFRFDHPDSEMTILTDNGANATDNSMIFTGAGWATVGGATSRELVSAVEVSRGLLEGIPASAGSMVQFINTTNQAFDFVLDGNTVASDVIGGTSFLDVTSGETLSFSVFEAGTETEAFEANISLDPSVRKQFILADYDDELTFIKVPVPAGLDISSGALLSVVNVSDVASLNLVIDGDDEVLGPFESLAPSSTFSAEAINSVFEFSDADSGAEFAAFAPQLPLFDREFVSVLVTGSDEPRLILAGSSGRVTERSVYEAGTALVQIIHNANDTRREEVAISLNGEVVIEELAFRTATPYLEIPANIGIDLSILTSASGFSFLDVSTELEADKRYVIVANGIATNNHADNPEGIDNSFGLMVIEKDRILANNATETDFIFVHGGTDAPTVQLFEQGSNESLGTLSYGQFSPYISITPQASTVMELRTVDGDLAARFVVDLETVTGEAGVLLANGFVNPNQNRNGDELDLMFVASDGEVIMSRNVTSADDSEDFGLPTEFALKANYPNPFNPTTTISYQLPEASHVQITVYDMLGRRVAVLVNEEIQAGVHNTQFDASRLASGMYLYRLQAGSFTETRKMMLIK